MRGNIGFGTRIPNTNISHARQTLIPYSTFSNSGAGGGRGRGSPLSSTGHTDFNGRVPGKPDRDESKSDSPVPPGSERSGLGHGRGNPLPPPSSGRSSFSSFLSSLKPQSAGRGQTTSPPVSQPTNDSGPKKPMFFKRDDSSSPTVETRPNISSIGDREVNNKLLGNMAGVLAGLGRGKPMKQPDPENQVKEENRHLRSRPTLDTTASKTVPKSQPAMNQEDAVMHARKILSQGGYKGGATGRGRGEYAGQPSQGRGQGRGRDGREGFTWRDRGEKDGRDKRVDDASAEGIYFEDPDDSGEKLAEKVGPEVMNQLVEGFEELADRVLPSPLYDEYLDALDINYAVSG